MLARIQSIVFDFGGVLVDWNPRNIYRHFFPERPQAMEDFFAEVNFMEWNAQQDKGRSFAEGVATLSKQFPHRAHLIRAFHERWQESISGSIAGTVEILRALKQKEYPLYGLSNWSAETFPMVRNEFEFLNLFDEIILSGEVKLIKPDPAIYELCLRKIGKPANECLFIDDSEANVAAARQMGFDVVRFISPELLRTELQLRKII
jgi:2-haloacid dehalogenase